MTSTKTDWDPIRKDYVLGIIDDNGLKTFPTHTQLSETYNVALGTIKNKASKEKWSQQKKSHKLKVTKKVIEKKSHNPNVDPEEEEEASEYDAETIVQSDADFEETGEKLRQAVKLDLEAYIQKGVSNPYHLKMLGDALGSAQSVVKTAQGEIIEKIGIDQNTNLKVDLTDPNFLKNELSFMNNLIKKD